MLEAEDFDDVEILVVFCVVQKLDWHDLQEIKQKTTFDISNGDFGQASLRLLLIFGHIFQQKLDNKVDCEPHFNSSEYPR